MHAPRYHSAPKNQKRNIAQALVEGIKASKSRFLQIHDEEADVWIEVNDEIAKDKVSHCFRSRRRDLARQQLVEARSSSWDLAGQQLVEASNQSSAQGAAAASITNNIAGASIQKSGQVDVLAGIDVVVPAPNHIPIIQAPPEQQLWGNLFYEPNQPQPQPQHQQSLMQELQYLQQQQFVLYQQQQQLQDELLRGRQQQDREEGERRRPFYPECPE